jgi:hypothetical protein
MFGRTGDFAAENEGSGQEVESGRPNGKERLRLQGISVESASTWEGAIMFGWFRKKKTEPPKDTASNNDFAKKCQEAMQKQGGAGSDKKHPTSPKNAKTPAGQNRIEEAISDFLKSGKQIPLDEVLAGFTYGDLTSVEQEAFQFYRVTSAFRAGDSKEAFFRATKAHEMFPTSARISFVLGQEFERRANPQEMIALFDTALFPAMPAQYALAEARYAYLWNRIPEAMNYVSPIFQAYFKLKIIDDTFLYIRGLPFFSESFRTYLCLCALAKRLQEARKLLDDAEKNLSDYDFAFDRLLLQAAETGNYDPLILTLEKQMPEYAKMKAPTGFARMMIAVIRARTASSVAPALQILDEVKLGGQDFPWLEDIRVLAKCQVFHRFGQHDKELEFRRQFFAKQPLLFEPYHAVTFGLIEYQEDLKAEYQKNKIAAARESTS